MAQFEPCQPSCIRSLFLHVLMTIISHESCKGAWLGASRVCCQTGRMLSGGAADRQVFLKLVLVYHKCAQLLENRFEELAAAPNVESTKRSKLPVSHPRHLLLV